MAANNFDLESKIQAVVEKGRQKHGAAFESAADVLRQSAGSEEDWQKMRYEIARRGEDEVMKRAGDILTTRSAVAKRNAQNFNIWEHGSDKELDLHMKSLAEKRRR
jgi:hypothetical protein